MAILRVKDNDGNIVEIPAIKGDKGDPGTGVVFGSYTGNASDGSSGTQEINLGFKAKVVLIIALSSKAGMDNHGSSAEFTVVKNGQGSYIGGVEVARLATNANGNSVLTVQRVTATGGFVYNLNEQYKVYEYIAFTE